MKYSYTNYSINHKLYKYLFVQSIIILCSSELSAYLIICQAVPGPREIQTWRHLGVDPRWYPHTPVHLSSKQQPHLGVDPRWYPHKPAHSSLKQKPHLEVDPRWYLHKPAHSSSTQRPSLGVDPRWYPPKLSH